MRWAWITGWSVPVEWLGAQVTAVWPEHDHRVFAAGPGVFDEMREAGPWDRLGAYSLGTLLALEAHAVAAMWPAETWLFAPIWAFPAEAGAGGRVPRAQLRYLQRWLARDPEAALADFRMRAGLEDCRRDAEAGDLAWGLVALAERDVPGGLPAGWRAWVGDEDALLDATVLARRGVEIVSRATHHPATLLLAAREAAGA